MQNIPYNPKIIVNVLEEAGYISSLIGLSLNKNQKSNSMTGVAKVLAPKDYGHNKFLESMIVWVEVVAPRYWWQEADTYRLSTKQSQSSWYTIKKAGLFSQKDFETELPENYLEELNKLAIVKDDLWKAKSFMPEGYMQKRIWCMSYKTLRNIIVQRHKHPMPHWRTFVKEIYNQVKHPEFLPELDT